MHVYVIILLLQCCTAFKIAPTPWAHAFHKRIPSSLRATAEHYFDPQASYLGIDYGNKYCGLAAIRMGVSDAFQPVFNGGNLTRLSLDILHETARAKSSGYIVGWPLDWDGRHTNLQAQHCLNFARVFAGVVEKIRGPGTPTFLVDERYTTDVSQTQFKKKLGALDGNSAYHILQRWLADEGSEGVSVSPVLNPSPELEIVNVEEAAWNAPREIAGFRKPRARYIGKRRVMHAAQPACSLEQ